MNVLMVHSYFPPYIGGVENVLFNLATRFSEDGNIVKVVTLMSSGSQKVYSIKKNLTVYEIGVFCKIANTPISYKLPFVLMKLIKDSDVVHTHIPTPFTSDIAVFSSYILRKPVFLTYHCDIVSYRFFERFLANAYTETLLKMTLNFATRIIALTKTYVNNSSILLRFSEKISVIPNGVDTSYFTPPSKHEKELSKHLLNLGEKKVILFVGLLDRFHEYKGLKYLILASKIILRKYKDVVFLIIGDGELRPNYERICVKLGVKENFVFLRRVSREKLHIAYKAADIFVLPSTTLAESFPLVLLEAAASGIAIVTTQIGGLPEIVEYGKAAALVKPRSPKDLGEKILDLLNDENYANTLSKSARELAVNKYDWKVVYQKYKKLFEEYELR